MEVAIRKVKRNGYLLLDNSERLTYKSAMEKLKKYERIDFLGFGPQLITFWKTTVWKIK